VVQLKQLLPTASEEAKGEQTQQARAPRGVTNDAPTQAPRIQLGKNQNHQCWGCHGLECYADTPPHLWRKCPHRKDPEVNSRAQQRIGEYTQLHHRDHSRIGDFQKEAQGVVGTPQDPFFEKRWGGVYTSW